MADPITLGTLGLGATALGGGVGAIGSIFGGLGKGSMYDYQSGIAQQNALIAKQNADYQRQVGGVEAQQAGMRERFQQGKITAGLGASGLDVNSGSARNVTEGQQGISTMEQGLIRSNAARRAYGFEVEAYNKTAESQLLTTAGSNARTAGFIGGASSILGAAGSVASKWYQAGSVGLGGGLGGYNEDNKY